MKVKVLGFLFFFLFPAAALAEAGTEKQGCNLRVTAEKLEQLQGQMLKVETGDGGYILYPPAPEDESIAEFREAQASTCSDDVFLSHMMWFVNRGNPEFERRLAQVVAARKAASHQEVASR